MAAAAAELRGAPQQADEQQVEEARRLEAAEAQLAHATALRARLLPRTESKLREEAGANHPDFLPERLHYDVMVPFGAVAFFPGRLIHTNEFMVSLGDGGVHHAERSATQAARILQRRIEGAEREAAALRESVRAAKARARALEGLLDIREEYDEEAQEEGQRATTSVSRQDAAAMRAVDDDEHARVMRRLAELEHAEEEAEAEGVEEGEAGVPCFTGAQPLPQPQSTQAPAQRLPPLARPSPQSPLVSLQPQPPPKEGERKRVAVGKLPTTAATSLGAAVESRAVADAFRGRVLERPSVAVATTSEAAATAAAATSEPVKRVSRFKQRAAERHT